MGVTIRGGGRRMAKQLADDGQTHRSPRADAGEGMSQVMQPYSLKPCGLADSGPWLFQIGARRALPLACDDMWITVHARERRKYQKRRRRKIDRLLARLAIRQKNHAALNIDMLPFRVENFAKASAGQDQKPDGRDCERIELRPSLVGFWRVLRFGVRLVDIVRQADSLAIRKRRPEPRQFVSRQEPFAALLTIFLQSLRRVMPVGDQPTCCTPCESFRPDCGSPIGGVGAVGHADVKGRDMRAGECDRLQRAMRTAKLFKRYAMAYRRSGLQHRPDVLDIK